MQRSDFNFTLPENLIAHYPTEARDASRLLVIDPTQQSIHHHVFSELCDFLSSEDCLIFNNTRVIPARLKGQRESGGQIECLFERLVDDRHFLAQVKSSNTLKPGTRLFFQRDSITQSAELTQYELSVVQREGLFYQLKVESPECSVLQWCHDIGQMPLPPYIDRENSALDKERYQTIYASELGAVAAPTAGLHFTETLFEQLKQKHIEHDFVTLHVGAGTFSPVRVDNILEHRMHSEWFQVSDSVVDLVRRTKAKGGRVIAVGTTSLRCLEAASITGKLQAKTDETALFIYPGYQFKTVDALITNFHLPESSLMMLVSAMAGQAFIMQAYQTAIDHSYRFFSYGDAMLIEHKIDDVVK